MVANKWTGPVAFDQSVLLLKHCLSLGPAQPVQAWPCPQTKAIRLTAKPAVLSDLRSKLPVKQAVWHRAQHSSNNCLSAAFRFRPLVDGSGDCVTTGARKAALMEPPYICITAPSASILNLNLEQLVKQQCSKREPGVTAFEKLSGTLDHTVASVPVQYTETLESTKIAVPTPSYQIAPIPIPIPVSHSLIHTNTAALRCTETTHVQWINKTDAVQQAESKWRPGSPHLLDRATPAQLSIALLRLREEVCGIHSSFSDCIVAISLRGSG